MIELMKKQQPIVNLLKLHIKTRVINTMNPLKKCPSNVDTDIIKRILLEFDLTSFQVYTLLVFNFTLHRIDEGKDLGLHEHITTDNFIKLFDSGFKNMYEILKHHVSFKPEWDITEANHKLVRYVKSKSYIYSALN